MKYRATLLACATAACATAAGATTGCVSQSQLAADLQKAALPQHMPKVVACWEQAFEDNGFVGEYLVVVGFSVDALGQLDDAQVDEAFDTTGGEPSPLADGGAFTDCVESALDDTKLAMSGPLTVKGYRIAFTDPNRAERERAAGDTPSQLIGPRADRCQGLYAHRPPRDAGQLQKLLGEARAETARHEKNPDKRARAFQRSYDLCLELLERLDRDAGRDDLTRAGKKRIRAEKKKIQKVRDDIAPQIGCD